MDQLRRELHSLIARLEATFPSPESVESVESVALDYLRGLETAATRTEDARTLDAPVGELRQFWLESIPWCSRLSRDIERIIIIQEDLSRAE